MNCLIRRPEHNADNSITLSSSSPQTATLSVRASHVARAVWALFGGLGVAARRRLGARETLVLNGGGRGDGPPDLDELWRDFNRKLSGLFGGKGGGPRPNGS